MINKMQKYKSLKKLSKKNKKKLEFSISNYLIIKNEFKKNRTNILRNCKFIDAFDSLYKLNERKLKFVDKVHFYQVLQQNRDKKKITYEYLLKVLSRKPSKKEDYEKVFASKILHTINNNMPIIDSKVFKNLTGYNLNDMKRQENYEKYTGRGDWETIKDKPVNLYSNIYNKYVKDINSMFKNTELLKVMIDDFNDFVDTSELNDSEKKKAKKINKIKKIDFILWIQ